MKNIKQEIAQLLAQQVSSLTPEEIEKGDVRPGGRRPETKEGSPETPGGDDKNRLKRILNMDEVK